eukprot:362154_1
MEDDAVSGWIGRTLFAIQFVIACVLFKSEPKKRKTNNHDNNGYYNVYDKLLNLWSTIFIISFIMYSLVTFLTRIPNICLYFEQLFYVLWAFVKIILLYYQIARLQYCFSSEQIHSKKNSYSNFTFYFLYFVGICFLLLCIYHCTVYAKPINVPSFGCRLIPNHIDFVMLYFVHIGLYTILDWSVLCMYIYKVIQIRTNTNFKDENIYQKIKQILRKILLLTVCNQIATMSSFSIDLFIAKPIDIIVFIDGTTTLFVLYLMIEHNHNHYLKFLWIISCGNINDECKKDDKTSNVQNTDVDVTVFDTRSQSLPTKLAIDASVPTLTNSAI